eukprot:COSAG05_NODE_15812_length_360_cov_1.314176_1_plen_82_part_01
MPKPRARPPAKPFAWRATQWLCALMALVAAAILLLRGIGGGGGGHHPPAKPTPLPNVQASHRPRESWASHYGAGRGIRCDPE